MDIDHRFGQFYENDSFVYYNMFNNHFFRNKETYTKFLAQAKNILLIIDPPFGGIVKLISNTIGQIKNDFGRDSMSTMLFYPYFTGMWINKWLTGFSMIDYKVSYQNQRKFSKNTSQKKGSTARIFTDIEPIQVELPADEGYTLCKLCKKYTFKENQHCKKCNGCMSKVSFISFFVSCQKIHCIVWLFIFLWRTVDIIDTAMPVSGVWRLSTSIVESVIGVILRSSQTALIAGDLSRGGVIQALSQWQTCKILKNNLFLINLFR